jgi:hypothetical protein
MSSEIPNRRRAKCGNSGLLKIEVSSSKKEFISSMRTTTKSWFKTEKPHENSSKNPFKAALI